MPPLSSSCARSPSESAGGAPIGPIDDEDELVARAKRDRHDFAPLYARYFQPIYRYCFRRLDDPEAAADATSLIFARALAALPTCRDGTFRSWLFAIAHNVVVDGYRARHPALPLEVAADLPDGAPSPEEQTLAAEERQTLRALLAHLPPDQRAVVELRLAGLTAVEIGRVLGKRRGAVDTAQFRAVARLRSLLGVAADRKDARDAN